MPFPPDLKTQALAACGRSCCICHKFCGIKMECHHIVQEADGGPNTLDNCIPLCFDCHADMLSYDDNHPKGTKYRPAELRLHRDNWFGKVNNARPSDYSAEQRTLDQGLFKRILKILPWNGSMRFIDHNNFAGFSFEGKALEDLWEFDDRDGDPVWEFVDPTLEVMRANLAQHVRKLIGLISRNTFPTHVNGRFSVPEDLEIEDFARFNKVVGEIHDAAGNCVTAYKTFIREGRHRLAVEISDEEPAIDEPPVK